MQNHEMFRNDPVPTMGLWPACCAGPSNKAGKASFKSLAMSDLDIADIAMMDTWCTPLRKILEHWVHLRIAFQKPSKDV